MSVYRAAELIKQLKTCLKIDKASGSNCVEIKKDNITILTLFNNLNKQLWILGFLVEAHIQQENRRPHEKYYRELIIKHADTFEIKSEN